MYVHRINFIKKRIFNILRIETSSIEIAPLKRLCGRVRRLLANRRGLLARSISYTLHLGLPGWAPAQEPVCLPVQRRRRLFLRGRRERQHRAPQGTALSLFPQLWLNLPSYVHCSTVIPLYILGHSSHLSTKLWSCGTRFEPLFGLWTYEWQTFLEGVELKTRIG